MFKSETIRYGYLKLKWLNYSKLLSKISAYI